MEITKLSTESEFREFTENQDTLNCVKFGAEWCGPCRSLDAALKAVAEAPDGVRFASADVDGLPSVVESLAVMNVPSISVFRGGEELDRIVGLCAWPQILARLSALS